MERTNIQKNHNVPIRSQRFFTCFFKGFVAFDTFRFKHPIIFSLCASVIVMIIVFFLTLLFELDQLSNPSWWKYTGLLSLSNVARAIISLGCGILLTQPLARGLLPMLAILPQAIAMKNLGLMFVSTSHGECARLILKASSEHNPNEKVKVICISGRYLFREIRMPGDDGVSLPLHDLAMKGQLDVIMPVSNSNNATIKARYGTYTKEFLMANGIPNIQRFIDYEIEAGKEFLQHYENDVCEHDILCMWRVIIFSEHCLVQNYFPNATKAESYRAPMFMYAKRADGSEPNSYYNTYLEMFNLIKSTSQPRTAKVLQTI
jgi:hypothetical protein